jgi:predicted nucleic acid-binding protein
MKLRKVILDTGPLVAFLNKNDRYHEWAIAQFGALIPPLLTCEAVLSESCFLLRHYETGASNVLNLLERGLLAIPFRLEDELSAIKVLLDKYRDIPMSLADGCLVRMAEQIADSVIFTLDSDFKIYRKDRRKVIPTIMPEDL